MSTSKRIELLDHGYLFSVEHWGSDERIIEAARMSTNKGFKGWGPRHARDCASTPFDSHEPCDCEPSSGDEKLLRYLYENKHSTPFEMAGMVIEVQCPIFVLRQWHRHRTQSYNEMSARYTPMPDMNYLPTADRCINVRGSKNKQARGSTDRTPSHSEVLSWLQDLEDSYRMSQAVYARGLALGITKELARLPVPVARYSRMRASANLRNWLAFMTLRSDTHAQKEIQVFSDALAQLISEAFPRTFDLWVEGMNK